MRLEPPAHLPPAVAETFATLAEQIEARLAAEDAIVVEMLATAVVAWRDAQAQVQRDGRVVMSGGTAIPHPALSVAQQAQHQIVTLCRELGLSPSARRKLKLAEPEPAESWLSTTSE
jgi:P27 family predicted phage terminase small subunit